MLAALLSTQFLFQPFIWRNFTFGEIMPAWAGILRDRLVVAACVAAALAGARALSPRTLGPRVILQGIAIVAGAIAGEVLLQSIASQEDRQDLLSFAGRVVRWTLVGGSIAALIYFWRSGSEFATAAENARVDDAQLRRVAASTKLEALKRQIEPHFLFNTLATIRRLRETEPERGCHLLERLFDYMSATIGEDATGASTLRDEIALVRAYLEVCAARMTGALVVECDVPDDLAGIDFPPLVLATLAENAIKHGVDAGRGGTIRIEAIRRVDRVEVTIADDGVGLGEKTGGSGIGLANISERLRLLYGPEATLRLSPNDPHGVRATVTLPEPAGPA